nr:xylulose kinase-1 [Tanacetum cinerariifolium]GEY49959.1 xylulose kinase-1 [Tanacetum cinerariifolium]
MEYWITNNDINIWKVIQNGNSLKRTGRDHDGRVIIIPPTTVEEHIAVQRESKARTTLLQSIPDNHVADFHYMDDARDIWNAVKARFGGNAKSKKMRKSMLKQEFLEFRIGKAEGLHKRTKVGLGFTNCISENELGWDDSAFSVFTTTSEDVEGRPVFHRFAKTDSMKAVPLPLFGDYTSLSDHIDLDESQMSYGTKSSTSCNSKSVSNDFVSCDDSDKSLEVSTNEFASSDSSVKSSEHQPNDSTSYASTSNVSTSVNEAEIKSNVGTPIKEPISIQNLPSFTCNSFDKNEYTSRTSCNKNGYFNKKAGYFRKHSSYVSKLCFVCGSGTHLIKDCDFYEKQMVNKTIGIGVGPVHNRNKVNHQNQFVPQAVLLRTGKVNIPPARPQPVPTGKPNRPFLVPTDRGYSPS